MAVKNGSRFLRSQIDSILPQLTGADELIISDDHSSDDSLAIIRSYLDNRIKIVTNPASGIVSNFEAALTCSRGDYIFLSDQDDVWAPNKLEIMCRHLKAFDLVVCDCRLIAPENPLNGHSYFDHKSSGRGLIKNLMSNSYMGCCMGFSRKVLQRALPFPKRIPMHDMWIGLIADLYFNVAFIREQLVYHRRHEGNASTSWQASANPLWQKVNFRFQIIKALITFSHA